MRIEVGAIRRVARTATASAANSAATSTPTTVETWASAGTKSSRSPANMIPRLTKVSAFHAAFRPAPSSAPARFCVSTIAGAAHANASTPPSGIGAKTCGAHHAKTASPSAEASPVRSPTPSAVETTRGAASGARAIA
jgi:hypothetical protein